MTTNGKINSGIVSVVLAILIACTTVCKNNVYAFTINDRSVLSTTTRIQYQQQNEVSSPSYSFSTNEPKGPLYMAGGEVPEPGPCPECSDTNGYWDGSTNFVCIACGNEWLVEDSSQGGNDNDGNDGIIRDSNGNILESGDTVVLTKELGKGLKKGMKVTRIRVGDFGDEHDVQANIPGMGTFNLKSQFLKKTK